MAKRTPPFPHYSAWTNARFWAFVRSALRQAHVKWPPAQSVMRKNRIEVTGKRHKYEHQCAECEQWVPQKEIEKDHKVPVGQLKCYEDLPGFVERLFVAEDGYRKICKACHLKHTNAERNRSKTDE